MSESNTIGSRIKLLREERNETQATLADALHVKRETVNQWENGARDIKTQYTVMLADHFEITCDYLLRGIKAENVSIHEKIGLSDEAIRKLEIEYRNKVIKIGEEIALISHFTKTVNLLLENPSAIEYISKFMFSGYAYIVNADTGEKANYIPVIEKGTDIGTLISTDEINDAYLVKAQREIQRIKENMPKESE